MLIFFFPVVVQGGSIQACSADKAQLDVCEMALRTALKRCKDPILVYARIDLVWFEESWRVSELELLDPELFLTHDKGAVDRFADSILNQIDLTMQRV